MFPTGREPLPPGMTEEDRAQLMQAKKYQGWMTTGMESCAAKTVIAGIGGKRATFGSTEVITQNSSSG